MYSFGNATPAHAARDSIAWFDAPGFAIQFRFIGNMNSDPDAIGYVKLPAYGLLNPIAFILPSSALPLRARLPM